MVAYHTNFSRVDLKNCPMCNDRARQGLWSLPPALKRRGSPRLQGLCSHLAHKWATFDFVPRSQAEGIPEAAGVM